MAHQGHALGRDAAEGQRCDKVCVIRCEGRGRDQAGRGKRQVGRGRDQDPVAGGVQERPRRQHRGHVHQDAPRVHRQERALQELGVKLRDGLERGDVLQRLRGSLWRTAFQVAEDVFLRHEQEDHELHQLRREDPLRQDRYHGDRYRGVLPGTGEVQGLGPAEQRRGPLLRARQGSGPVLWLAQDDPGEDVPGREDLLRRGLLRLQVPRVGADWQRRPVQLPGAGCSICADAHDRPRDDGCSRRHGLPAANCPGLPGHVHGVPHKHGPTGLPEGIPGEEIPRQVLEGGQRDGEVLR
mmetsp:Transcript_69181/g.196016  ORF Transcript_69181/g.196016 Transcript_69181/m.196016 type:complete len:296 (-) Transcript_69181:543-1430(-)